MSWPKFPVHSVLSRHPVIADAAATAASARGVSPVSQWRVIDASTVFWFKDGGSENDDKDMKARTNTVTHNYDSQHRGGSRVAGSSQGQECWECFASSSSSSTSTFGFYIGKGWHFEVLKCWFVVFSLLPSSWFLLNSLLEPHADCCDDVWQKVWSEVTGR